MRELVRLVIFIILTLFLISDVIELLSYLPPTTLTMAPLLQRMIATTVNYNQKLKSVNQGKEESNNGINPSAGNHDLRHRTLHVSSAANSKVLSSKSTLKNRKQSSVYRQIFPTDSRLAKIDFSAEEIERLMILKAQWMEIMQTHCLPKLVCELHASLSGENSLTEMEMGLLSAIKETSIGTSAGIISRYHFAAHMGQLLSGVEGNGCHNFYPKCPLSGINVLQMVKKVKVR